MDYPIGIEMSKDYLSFEIASSALKLMKNVMLVKPHETVVITADSSSDKRVVEATAKAAFSIGAEPVIINYPTTFKAFEEPCLPIAEAVAKADVWIEYSYYCLMHTPCFQKAMKYGTRYTCLTGMDVIMMVNTIGKIDYDLVVEFGEYLTEYIQNSNEIIIKDSNGTNLTSFNQGRKVKHSGQLATKKGYPIMLAGQVSWCPVEETINGTLVFDAAVFPPSDLGKLNNNITLELKNGVVEKISGGKDAEIFSQWLSSFDDPNMYRLAHYSIGFNPGVTKATGRIVEDERIFGCIEFGLGSQGESLMGAFWNAAAHTDGVVSQPTIIADGKYLEKDGVYVDPTAIEYCKKLNINGY